MRTSPKLESSKPESSKTESSETESSKLERRYRRLLACYPASFRRDTGPEILAVLLASAREGQQYPGIADSVDLITGGLGSRIRLRMSAQPSLAIPRGGSSFPPPSSVREPESYGQALQTVWWNGFRPTMQDWSYPHPPAWLRRIGSLGLAVSFVLFVLGGYRHFFDDHPFLKPTPSALTASVAVGRSIWVSPGLTSDAGSISLRALSPNVVSNSADANVVVEQCAGDYTSSLTNGALSYDAPDLCTSLSAFEPLAVGSGSLTVVLKVTPRRSGAIEIKGVNVAVAQGLRRGNQDAGIDWTINAHS